MSLIIPRFRALDKVIPYIEAAGYDKDEVIKVFGLCARNELAFNAFMQRVAHMSSKGIDQHRAAALEMIVFYNTYRKFEDDNQTTPTGLD